MDKYYIDLSVQDSSVLLNNNYEKLNNNNNSNFNINNNNNNNNDDIIEGFGNFGRVNLEKCCPLEYMWSEGQKKCVKVCDGCAIGAYGNINYEFLTSNGEFMSFAQCVGDATEAYDFDKINRRFGIDELVTQYDINHHIDSDPNASGVQPAEENPWANLDMSKAQSGSVRNIGSYAADAQEAYLQSIGQSVEQTTEYSNNRILLCSSIDKPLTINQGSPSASYQICTEGSPNEEEWNNLCGLEDSQYTSLEFSNICNENNINENNNNDIVNRLCNEDNTITKNLICPDNR